MDPLPIIVAGRDTGFDTCRGGTIRRRAVVECPINLGAVACQASDPTLQHCSVDSDCDAGSYGYCEYGEYRCDCNYGCARDSDCPAGDICFCGDPVGTCVPASCNAGTCGGNAECASYTTQCSIGFACQTPADRCFSDSDCTSEAGQEVCTSLAARVCTQPANCSFGRPFVVDDAARLSQAVLRDDWLVRAAPQVGTLSSSLRARLAQHWIDTARMEHASVAAFARVVLQLLALGAPHDLVADAERAMADETKHARLAFGLASAYAGSDLGPGPIAIDRCLDDGGVGALVATTFIEGCVGETVAALEACEALAHAQDPAVRAVLETLAREEAQHAEHAWRTVAWALTAFGQTARDAMQAEVSALEAQASVGGLPGIDEDRDALLAHGILTNELRNAIRRTALRSLIVPLAIALLESQRSGRDSRPRKSSIEESGPA
jgi:hypothetical protein